MPTSRTVPVQVIADITGLDEYKRVHAFEAAVRARLEEANSLRRQGEPLDHIARHLWGEVGDALKELETARADSKRDADLAVEVKTPEVWEESRQLKRRVGAAEEMVAALLDREQTLLRPVIDAAPSVERLRELVKWCDLLDTFASKVDPAYALPRDEIQQDLTRLADALEAARGGDGRGE